MMKLSERVFNIIDRSREFIETRGGVDLLAIAELPPLNETLEFLSNEADNARDGIEQIEAREASARAIMEKFVNKVDTGRARSKETYREMKAWLEE